MASRSARVPYLAGNAPEEWIPLRSAEFYQERDIDLKLGVRVAAIDTVSRHMQLVDGSRHAYDALLLATGAEPVRLDLPGGDLPHVHYLRTLADSRALVAKALASQRAVVIGASFIGLEVAASRHLRTLADSRALVAKALASQRAVVIGASFIGLEVAASRRARHIDVHVVGRETCPMEKILGAEIGNFIRKLHEEQGVTFHLGTTAASIGKRSVTLQSGENLPPDLVVIGAGVRPAITLAEQAGPRHRSRDHCGRVPGNELPGHLRGR